MNLPVVQEKNDYSLLEREREYLVLEKGTYIYFGAQERVISNYLEIV